MEGNATAMVAVRKYLSHNEGGTLSLILIIFEDVILFDTDAKYKQAIRIMKRPIIAEIIEAFK